MGFPPSSAATWCTDLQSPNCSAAVRIFTRLPITTRSSLTQQSPTPTMRASIFVLIAAVALVSVAAVSQGRGPCTARRLCSCRSPAALTALARVWALPPGTCGGWRFAPRAWAQHPGLCERHMRVSALPTLLLAPLHSHDCTATGRKPCSGSRCSERTLLWAVAAWGPGRCSRSPAKAHQVPWCTPAPPSPSPLASPTHPLSPPPLPSFR